MESKDPTARKFWIYGIIPLCLVSLSVLVLFYSVDYLHSDSAQTLSVAGNIINGSGFKTSIVYYEQHHNIGGIPVEQTVFPPGLSVLAAIFHWLTGASEFWSLYLICAISFILIPNLLYYLFVQMGLKPLHGFVLASTSVLFVQNWLQAFNFASELTFIVILLSCVIIKHLADRGQSKAWVNVALIGFLAGLSMALRYVGIFFVLSLGIYYFLVFITKRNKKSFVELCILTLSASIIPVLLFARNYWLTETISGGPQVAEGGSLIAILYGIRWQISTMFGFFIEGFNVPEVLLLLTLAYLLYFVISRSGGLIKKAQGGAFLSNARGYMQQFHPVSAVSTSYVVTTLIILLIYAYTKSSEYFYARYLMVLIPFVLIVIADAVRIYFKDKTKADKPAVILFVSLYITYSAGQIEIAPYHINYYLEENTNRELVQPLRKVRVENQTVFELLQKSTSAENPLLTNKAQRLWVYLDRPLVSLTPSLFTAIHWDESRVRQVLKSYNIQYILLYKRFFDPGRKQFLNQPVYTALLNQPTPDWLELLTENDEFVLWRVGSL